MDGDILAPWPSLPRPHGVEGPTPILRLQANFVSGGLLLNLSLHHNVVDFTGILQFVRLLALVVSGGEPSAEDIEQANRDRRRIVPLLKPTEPIKDHSHLRRPAGFVPEPCCRRPRGAISDFLSPRSLP